MPLRPNEQPCCQLRSELNAQWVSANNAKRSEIDNF